MIAEQNFLKRLVCCNQFLALTLSWRRSLSYRSQSIDLQSKSMDWFLYYSDLRHERVKGGLNWNSYTLDAHYIAMKSMNYMSVCIYLIVNNDKNICTFVKSRNDKYNDVSQCKMWHLVYLTTNTTRSQKLGIA